MRDARQRLLIATRAMANREIRNGQEVRDRAFGELVHKRIYLRTGGNVRDWLALVAGIKRILYMVGVGLGQKSVGASLLFEVLFL